MRKIIAMALSCVLCLMLCSCGAKEQAELLTQKNQELEEYALKLEQSVQTLTQERDDLNRQLQDAQTELQSSRDALSAAQSDIAALEETIKALEEEIHELKYPPLEPCGTIRLFGVDADVLTDGTFEYVLFDSFKECSGLELNAEDYALREWQEEVYISLDAAEQMPNIVLDETKDGVRFLAVVKDIQPMTENVNVPVLMYHAVSDDLWGIGELFVKPAEMEKQLAWLVDNGYDPIWFEDLSHLEDYDKPVILTFDDGYDDNYTQLYPLLQKYNVKATIFVIGNAFGMNHKMTAEQIHELSKSGLVSIQSHGYTHKDMDVMDEKTLEYELGESQRVIAAVTGEMPYVLCYPSGKHSNLTVQVAERYYSIGLKMNGGLYNTDDDPFRVNRYYVSRYTDIQTFGAYCASGQ